MLKFVKLSLTFIQPVNVFIRRYTCYNGIGKELNDYSFPVLLDTDYAVSLEYGVFGIPMTYFIDKDGIIRVKKIGGFLDTAEIEGYLDAIMP